MTTLQSFMYHDVRDLNETAFPKRYVLKSFLRRKQFENQLDYIQKNYEVIHSRDILNIDFKKDNKNLAVLTFDDGLKDHYTTVYPLLKERNMPATFFVPTKPLTDNMIIVSHMIQFILAAEDEYKIVEIILNELSDSEKIEIYEKYSKSKWKKNWWSKNMIFVTNYLRERPYEAHYFFNKIVRVDNEEFSKNLYLSFQELEHIANDSLFTIGCHGDISENYINMKNVDILTDISRCVNIIKSYTDFLTVSYPNGGYNDLVKNTYNICGTRLGFTVEQKTLTSLDYIDYMEMPRYER